MKESRPHLASKETDLVSVARVALFFLLFQPCASALRALLKYSGCEQGSIPADMDGSTEEIMVVIRMSFRLNLCFCYDNRI